MRLESGYEFTSFPAKKQASDWLTYLVYQSGSCFFGGKPLELLSWIKSQKNCLYSSAYIKHFNLNWGTKLMSIVCPCPRWMGWISFLNYGKAKHIYYLSTLEGAVVHDLSIHFDFWGNFWILWWWFFTQNHNILQKNSIGCTFMIMREIWKKVFFQNRQKNSTNSPLRFWVKNHCRKIKIFSQKSKCMLKSWRTAPSKVLKYV